MQRAPDTSHYYYDQRLGDPKARFLTVAEARPGFGRPEMPATFVVAVEGESYINSMWGGRPEPWRSEPGTPCVILGYWSDDTVRLSWPAIHHAYRVDGRFPSWVVAENPDAPMAAGGHILAANNPPQRAQAPFRRLARFLAHVLQSNH